MSSTAELKNYFNIRGVILDANGNTLVEQFIVTDVPANQFHYTAAFNSKRNQYLITYNDFRDDVSSVYAVIIDDTGAVVKKEFLLCNATGHQVNPVVCYNPKDDTWLINWEDFRAHGNSLEALGTLEVMTDIYGALLSGDGTIIAGDIPMCADADSRNADQRFNGITYNPKKNEFLTSWTDTREQIKNVAVVGRIVKADGTMPADDFALVNAPGAQMVSHTHYVEGDDAYFVAFERDRNDVDKFYFKDIKAKLDIGAQWLDSTGRPTGEIIDIFSGTGNHRFVRFAYSKKSDAFLLVWQSDFPGVSDSVEGHIMSAGGNIMGAVYKKIERQLKGRDITDPAVLQAMEDVPRHRFVRPALQEHGLRGLPPAHRPRPDHLTALCRRVYDADARGATRGHNTGNRHRVRIPGRSACPTCKAGVYDRNRRAAGRRRPETAGGAGIYKHFCKSR